MRIVILILSFSIVAISCYENSPECQCPIVAYICNNEETEVYHTNINCYTLQNCKADKIILDLDSAKKLYRQCEICKEME